MMKEFMESVEALLEMLSAPFLAIQRFALELVSAWRFDVGDLLGSLNSDDSI